MENKDIIRDSIADLLADNDFTDDIDSQTLTFQRTPSTVSNMEVVTLEQSRQKAEKVMSSLLKVYLSENYISKSEYVQAKANLDAMTLGSIMNQMEISQRAINYLMEEIEMGGVNPKIFESLGKLQTTFIELVKTQTSYIMTAGEEYEKIALDKDTVVGEESTTSAKEISSGYKSSSQKDLMRLIRGISDKDK